MRASSRPWPSCCTRAAAAAANPPAGWGDAAQPDSGGADSDGDSDPSVAVAADGAPQTLQTPTDLAQASAVQGQSSPAATDAAVGPQTVARLAVQIAPTAQGPASQFSLTLHPAELGGVQVKVQVDRNGSVSAMLTFDNPQAAADLGARAGDLKAALNQAGFNVSDNGLSFNLSSQGQGQSGNGQPDPGNWGGRAFRAAAAGADDLLSAVTEAAGRLQTASAASGLDIRI